MPLPWSMHWPIADAPDAPPVKHPLMLWQLLPMTASVLSFGACSWLLLRAMPRVPSRKVNQLLLTQLRYLARADLLLSVGGLLMKVPEFVEYLPHSSRRTVCNIAFYGIWGSQLCGFMASIVFEAHLALGVTLGAWMRRSGQGVLTRRWNRTSLSLLKVLPWLWLLAIALTLVDLLLGDNHTYSEERATCFSRKGSEHMGSLSTPLLEYMVVCVLSVNVIACGALCCAPRDRPPFVPDSVHLRSNRHVRRYCLVTIATWCPLIVAFFLSQDVHLSWSTDIYDLVVTTAISLNGALNVWCFALHNRHLRGQRVSISQPCSSRGGDVSMQAAGSDELQTCESFHAAFGRVEIQEIPSRHDAKAQGEFQPQGRFISEPRAPWWKKIATRRSSDDGQSDGPIPRTISGSPRYIARQAQRSSRRNDDRFAQRSSRSTGFASRLAAFVS